MSVATLAPPHPILGCAAALRTALAEVADAQPVYLATEDKQRALVELARVEAQVAELRLRVLAVSDEVGQESGARDAAAWMAHATRAEPEAARSDVRLAKALERHPLVAEGMRTGAVSAAQARAIVAGVDALPAELGPELAEKAEATLVGYAEHHRPRELRRLARRILDVVAPEIAEAEEGKRLADEERRAREDASLRFHDLGDGRTRIRGILPTSVADRLKAYLQAYTSPRQPATRVRGERVPQHRAYAHAFSALLELLDPERLPEHGGDATMVVVTMTLEQLRSELATATATTPDGVADISAAEARRLACQASIVPMVLGGRSEVLDLGRRSRLFRAAQRRVIRSRDQQCRAEGCTIPARWCEVHHLRPWSQGGATDVDDGVNFCSHHHHLVHDERYEVEWLPSGDARFRRRR